MKRFRIVYKEEAISDLEAIRKFIDQSSSGDSGTVMNAVLARIRSLEYLAMSFRVRHPRKTPGLSIYAVVQHPYIIYYRVDEREGIVRIQTVRHGARRVDFLSFPAKIALHAHGCLHPGFFENSE